MAIRTTGRLALFALVGATILFQGLDSAGQEPQQCNRYTLDKHPPQWVSSISWRDQREGSILIVDGIDDILRPYTTSGRFIPPAGKAGLYDPIQIQALSKGFLLEEAGDLFTKLTQDLKAESEPIRLAELPGSNGFTIGTINGFTYSEAIDRLITFSFIKDSAGDWFSAFLSIPLNEPTEFSILDKVEGVTPGSKLYLMGLDLLSLGPNNSAYALSYLGESPELLIISGADLTEVKSYPLHDISSGFPARLDFELDNRASPKDQYANLEQANFVTGIYGSADQSELYLLHRQPDLAVGTVFTLNRVDIKGGMGAGPPITLPTDRAGAHHLNLLFGGSELVVLERGPVIDIGNQETNGLLQIPTRSFAGEQSLQRPIDLRLAGCN